MNKWIVVAVCCGLGLLAAVGPKPRFVEELCVGGGLGESVDGGADFEKDGDIRTDGDVGVKGDVSAGSDEALDHALAVTTGNGRNAAVNLNEADANNGGSVWYDGTANRLHLGTRSGSSSPVVAASVPGGSSNFVVAGDIAVNGGDIMSNQGCLQLDPVGSGRFDISGSLGKARLYNDGAGNTSIDFFMWNSTNATTVYGELFCLPADSTAGSEDGRITVALKQNGNLAYNRLVLDSDGSMMLEGDLQTKGGDVIIGQDSSIRGVVTAWDGSGGNTPGCLRLGSPNGTTWYVFVEDDGTLRIHNALPTQNSDGSVVGGQS